MRAHLFLSGKHSRAVRAALAAGDTATVAAKRPVAGDTDGDGKADEESRLRSSAKVDQLIPAQKVIAAERGTAVASGGYNPDPCQRIKDDYPDWPCQNVMGDEWKAPRFWASNTQAIHCPSEPGPEVGNPVRWTPRG